MAPDSTPEGADTKVVVGPFGGRPATESEEFTPLSREALAAMGVVSMDVGKFDKLDLKEPGVGERVVGKLTDDEAALFCDYHEAAREAERVGRGIAGGFLRSAAEAVENAEEEQFVEQPDKVSAEDALRSFRLDRKRDLLHNLLYWQLGERFNAHDHVLGVRTKRRVVIGKRKW